MLTSCHCEHEKFTGYLSSLQVGNVVCSDGNILSMDKFRQSGKEPIAIVFHVNRSPDADNRKHSANPVFPPLKVLLSFA